MTDNNSDQSSIEHQEQRQEYRLHAVETVFIEAAAASFDDSQPAEILVARSLDLSANGMQVRLHRPLAQGSILQASMKLHDREARIPLTVEVKWVKEDADTHLHGLELLACDDSALSIWKALVADKLEEDKD